MTDEELKRRFDVVGVEHEQQDPRDNHHFTVRSTRTLLRAEAIEIQERHFGYPQMGYDFMYFGVKGEKDGVFTHTWSCAHSCE